MMTKQSTINNQRSTVLILGHRGARKYAPENTMASFRKLLELNADGVEFDVISTLDGVPVVIHDNNISYLTGENIHINKTPYSLLLNIDVGRHFGDHFSGEKIPTLREALELMISRENTVRPFIINIELKKQSGQNKNFIKRVVEIIKGLPELPDGMKIIVSSFSPDLLYRFGRIAPDYVGRSLLMRPRAFYFLHGAFFASITAITGVNPHTSILSKNFMNFARLKSWTVMVWTANTKEDITKAIDMGVDGIITDDVVLAQEILRNRTDG